MATGMSLTSTHCAGAPWTCISTVVDDQRAVLVVLVIGGEMDGQTANWLLGRVRTCLARGIKVSHGSDDRRRVRRAVERVLELGVRADAVVLDCCCADTAGAVLDALGLEERTVQ